MPDQPAPQATAPTQAIDSKTTLYVVSILVLCVLTVVFVLAISALRPTDDNTSLIVTVVGVIVPVIMALLAGAVQETSRVTAGAVQEVHLAVNSRLTQLLELTAQAYEAKGKLQSK